MTASDARRAEARGSGFFTRHLEDADPEVWSAIEHEAERQQNEIELIASENIVSQAVLDAAGTLLTNKYAEGYPGKRSPVAGEPDVDAGANEGAGNAPGNNQRREPPIDQAR